MFTETHSSSKPQRRDKRSKAKPQPNRAKRLECVELARALEYLRCSTAGASSTHSKRFANPHAPKILASRDRLGLWQRRGSRSVVLSAFLCALRVSALNSPF